MRLQSVAMLVTFGMIAMTFKGKHLVEYFSCLAVIDLICACCFNDDLFEIQAVVVKRVLFCYVLA